MKFRTEIEILPYDRQLSYDDRLLALGSCFAVGPTDSTTCRR